MTFHSGLSRDGPGLLVRDLYQGKADDELHRITRRKPDVVVLQNVDYDFDQVVAEAIKQRLSVLKHDMNYSYMKRPNTGIESGFDLDRNGKLGEPRDMLGYGRFSGQGGMLILSQHPILEDDSRDLSSLLWRDEAPDKLPPNNFYSQDVLDILPLHSVAAWDVGIQTPNGILHILTSHASTPVFDGPEDRNGLRNASEIRFWNRYISQPHFSNAQFVLLGTLNNDPLRGEGRKDAINNLVNHPRLQDPLGGPKGNAVTATWSSGLSLRVDFILPSRGLGVRAAQVDRAPQSIVGSWHDPLWADLVWQ